MAGGVIRLNVRNIKLMLMAAPREYDAIRFDSIDNCNVQCVYCHNPRSAEKVDPTDFDRFLDEKVLGARTFQFGCVMEPTLDPRLCDFMLRVAQSPARATRSVVLQTNGLLLHRHDFGRMREAGLTDVHVSIDAADEATHKSQRGGSSLSKAIRNIRTVVSEFPDATFSFITTVTRLNIDGIPDLIRLGLSIGVKRFTFRQVFYHPANKIVDHARMPDLVLQAGEYAAMKERVLSVFSGQARFWFLDGDTLGKQRAKVSEASLAT